MEEICIRASAAPWHSGVEILVRVGNAVVSDFVTEIPTIGNRVNPSVTLSLNEAQMLMDDLWQCGLRPSEGSGSAGSLRATERHLEDMRRLVFKTPEKVV